jgi:N-acetylglutamate synthase-like GNAT family acetyltransferase
MKIREAVPTESKELQRIQAESPQGKSLIVSTVNIPNFFSRANAYKSHKVFVAEENGCIIGSAACAIREAVLAKRVQSVGYEFQYFTSPGHRRRGIAHRLRDRIESHLIEQSVVLSYALIMKGNLPSMRLFEGEGFQLHRKLIMPAIAVNKEVKVRQKNYIRTITDHDLQAVADLLNETWKGREFYEPTSAAMLADQIERVSSFDYSNLLVFEDQGHIQACVGLWDWSKIMRITVLRLNLQMRILGRLLVLARILPRFPAPGDTLNQMMLTMIGYRSPDYLKSLVRYVNNLARREGIEQVFCICDKGDRILKAMKGFTRVDTRIALYVKPLNPDILVEDGPVAMTGFDM